MLAPALIVLALLACASAVTGRGAAATLAVYGQQSRTLDVVRAAMCHYEGRHYAEGAVVPVRAPCLRCRCGRGAVSCRRRTCAAPRPTSESCQNEGGRDPCCSHMYCSGHHTDLTDIVESLPDPITKYEEVYPEVVKSHTHEHPVCVEEGTRYAAGSAMSSGTSCEQCFCLGGARRCVRPQCLRPPLGCRANSAPGVCCPQHYHCDHSTTKPPIQHHLHDCQVEGRWVLEGERVASPEGVRCSQCFCLRGAVRCQALACAPPLLGCRPLLEAGQCCPHQYQCVFQQRQGLPDFHTQPISDNTLSSFQNRDRSFRSAPPMAQYNVTTALSSTVTDKTTTSLMVDEHDSTATTKVKRKTNDSSTQTTSKATESLTTSTATAQTTTKAVLSTDRTTSLGTETSTPEEDAMEQPESSVKIIINGTINCTAELSTTTITINSTSANETEKLYSNIENIQPRIPNIAQSIESHTYNPNDIITDRNYNEDFDENESYIINVTSSLISSLRTNSTLSSPAPAHNKVTDAAPPDSAASQNNSKKTKDEYDYYYKKPTLPPSLPNLKIIPFVAADAVVDDDTTSKKSHAYPVLLDGHDKYPVYYPSGEGKDVPFATRREDSYNPTQFPIFLSKKIESAQYPLSAHEVHLTNEYPSNGDIITSVQEYSVTTALGNDLPHANRPTTKLPGHNNKFDLDTPVVNLFSPPVETEGGFVPKDPHIIDDFYALYTTSPPPSIVPHLTTSMQLDTSKECVSEDGQRIVEGEAIRSACSVCTCAWGEVRCATRRCTASPPGCSRRPAAHSAIDLCCGDLICNSGNKTTPSPQFVSTRSVPVTLLLNKSQEIPTNSTDAFTELSKVDHTTPRSYTRTTASPKITTISSAVINEEQLKSEVTNVNLEQSSTEKNEQSGKATTVAEDSERDSENSQEYDDDTDDDDGFSLGSVLKLLLSESYATTTAASVKQSTVPVTQTTNIVTKTTQAPTTTTTTTRRSSTPLVSMTNRPQYMPVKHQQPQSAINRIDHLILGESSAIKKMTPRPATVPFKPIPTRKPAPPKISTTDKPIITSKPVQVTKKTDYVQYTSITQENVRPSTSNHLSGGLGPGFLKLAGCNIYGKMYRVERIIAELSSSCQECRCTELGVQCRQLGCSDTTG
ncbi:PREDICTED: mucin-5AC isoform X1 [Papilio xuthus]|uniref:Mucin-5AC isoform X1 n=2 Tax=Papilio xuthus TaxID=66420 RepID=A0AAJ6ZZ70_PAPXU|nr:PREDICTED: mucin-5AC isoform X1 [Papilio xuthus]